MNSNNEKSLPSARQRITWIDTWKGIGIITVVVAHIAEITEQYIGWFHMPLFFFISGYLFKVKTDYFSFFKKKFLHLLVPYFSFLLLLSLPLYTQYTLDFLQNPRISAIRILLGDILLKLYGGAYLRGWFTVFWFITCLFLTQQLYNVLYDKFGQKKWLFAGIIVGAYCLSTIDSWFLPNFKSPWAITVVGIALLFYWMGHLAKQYLLINNKTIIAAIVIVTAAVIINESIGLHLIEDMKSKVYGIPILNFLVAIACIVLTQQLAKSLDGYSYIGNILSELGQASMIIMYLHQVVHYSLRDYPVLGNELMTIIAALIIPYFIYKIISQFSLGRKLLLGEFSEKELVKKPSI